MQRGPRPVAPRETVPVGGVYSPVNADGKEMKSGEAWTTDLVVGKAKEGRTGAGAGARPAAGSFEELP
ncbi:hypothetical protein ABT403_29155 [Streptomyces sp. NPDC000075]|uniref:hypothetical protein n=1 Tax=Streptomyces TaxID=1883 RepID=UPI0031E39201